MLHLFVASVNPTGDHCPYALLVLATHLLMEITAFLRESHQQATRISAASAAAVAAASGAASNARSGGAAGAGGDPGDVSAATSIGHSGTYFSFGFMDQTFEEIRYSIVIWCARILRLTQNH